MPPAPILYNKQLQFNGDDGEKPLLMFKGSLGLIVKTLVITVAASILSLLAQSAFAQGQVAIAIFLALSVILLLVTYFSKRTGPLKFLSPGLILLTAFVILPIVYTLAMSGFNYKTGNYISKDDAIVQIEANGFVTDPDGTAFDIVIGTYQGKPAVLATSSYDGKYFICLESERITLNAGAVTFNGDGVPLGAVDFTPNPPGNSEISGLQIQKFYFDGEYQLTIESLSTGILAKENLRYLPEQDAFKDLQTGVLYVDNKRGNYANPENKDEILEPGWRAPIWFENYSSLLTDSRIRGPLFSVTLWTFAFALLSVLTQFAFGLVLGLALNKKIRGRRIYRSILILPYAMPSIMSVLIWGGMFNTEFGAINTLLGTNIAWFQDANFARFAIILVNLWLGFPYFYLVSSGALQAIPSELMEAAAIDGANPRQIFRKITLPLLLQILTPLLIASFAFNFNNFNLIYLLTGGGPKDTLGGDIAGATDILISYTYQIAFGTGTQDLGLASAISVVIFFIVAGISLYGVRRSKVLESFL